MEEKLTSRKKQSIKQKKNIFDNAKALFKEYGYDNVSVNQICSGAGISVGTFYHYYPSKEHVIIQIAYDIDDYFIRKEKELVYSSQTEKILQLMKFQAEYSIALGLDLSTVTYKALIGKKEIDHLYSSYLIGLLNQAIRAGQDSGEFRSDEDPKELTEYLITLIRGTDAWWVQANGSFDLLNKIETYTRVFLQSISK